MADVEGLQARLHKIEAPIAGAGTLGECDAAGAALERVKARLAEQARRDPPVELQFSMLDAWSRSSSWRSVVAMGTIRNFVWDRVDEMVVR